MIYSIVNRIAGLKKMVLSFFFPEINLNQLQSKYNWYTACNNYSFKSFIMHHSLSKAALHLVFLKMYFLENMTTYCI